MKGIPANHLLKAVLSRPEHKATVDAYMDDLFAYIEMQNEVLEAQVEVLKAKQELAEALKGDDK